MMMTMPDQPLIAIDVVPVTFSAVDGLLFGTATRNFEPYSGEQALPGVLLGAGELLTEAAYRALSSKAGIETADVRHLAQLGAFDGPGRDPRTHAISIAFIAVVDPGAGDKTEWHSSELRSLDLPFDHDEIIDAARTHMRTRLWSDVPLTHALTGTIFNSVSASEVESALTGVKPHAGNLHRQLTKSEQIEKLEDPTILGRGRPVSTWRWLP